MNKKITELPAATTPISAGVKFEAVQGGINVQVDASDMPGSGGGSGIVETIVAGTNVTVDSSDPANPIISATGGGGAVDSVNGETGVVVLDAGDIGFTPTGSLSATDVQAAIAELDAEKVSPVGIHDLYIPVSAMWPRVTSGCSTLIQYEMATSLFNIQGMEFSDTVQQFAQFQLVLPRRWNNGTVTAVVYWKPLESGSGTVQWGISAGAYSNDDALTVALGTAQTVDDTFIATDDLHITSATSAITVAGTPADADFLALQISRNPASDTLAVNAILLGVSVRITTDAATDA